MFRYIFLVLFLFSSAAYVEPIAGQATDIDGDTIEIHGERIRLNGVDAPESRQDCERADGTAYRCGKDAAFALANFIGRGTVTCERRGVDRYKRTIGTCQVRGEDIGAWLVRAGHALAFRRFSMDYVPEEARAVEAKAGVWQGRFVTPWDWRRGVR
jgi:endonuclease YncB( thermonuclease family)